jgi:hypothetical protein
LAFLTISTNQAAIVAEHILAVGGILPLLSFIARPISALRLWAIKVMLTLCCVAVGLLSTQIIGKLWELSKKEKSDKRREKTGNFLAYNWPSTLKKSLQSFELQESTYLALMEVLIEIISPTSLKNPVHTNSELSFKNPEFLTPIFELLNVGGHLEIQSKALKDFSILLSMVCSFFPLFFFCFMLITLFNLFIVAF